MTEPQSLTSIVFVITTLCKNIQEPQPKLRGIADRAQHLQFARSLLMIMLALLFNFALSLHYFPLPWKNANIVTIPKQGKNPLLPQNRRPISLLNTLGKVYERIILIRIQKHALYVTPDTQFGFVPQRSTTLQLLRLVEYIQSGFNHFEHTVAVFLDVEKAYDSVWFSGLLYKLIQFDFPDTYIHIIASFLFKRTFQVKMEGALSCRRKILAGVPQGSILAPTLYNIYASDLPPHHSSQIAQYADDTVLYYKHVSILNCVNNINCHLKKATQWCNKWRIKINENKTQCVVFSRRNPSSVPLLKLADRKIEYSKDTKYLGIYLDHRLSWNKHFTNIRGKTLQRIHQLYPLFSSPYITLEKKVNLYKSLIRSAMLYSAPAWGTASKYHIQTLQVLQTKLPES